MVFPLFAAEETVFIADPIVNVTPTAIPTPTIDPALAAAMANAGQPLDFSMKINPWFDWQVLLGIPFWVFVTAGFLLLLISVNASWMFKMRTLSAVNGYVETLKRATQEDVQVWILGKVRKLTIECMRYCDAVISYYDKVKISRWHHNTPMSVIHIGGSPAMIVSDDFDQTRDIMSEIAITYNCDIFNRDQERLQKEFDKRGITDPVIKPITNFTDYSEYGRKALELIFPDGLPIPSYSIFFPEKFRKYFPLGCSAGFFGGEIIMDSRDLKIDVREPTFWEKYAPLGFISGMCLVAILAAWMAPL